MTKGRIIRPEDTTRIVLPMIGRLKTGRKNASGFPESVDYFIPQSKYASFFTRAYGEKPNVIQVVFFDENLTVSCNERYEIRDSDGRLFAKGDGETFEVWTGKNYQEFTLTKVPDIMERVAKESKSKKGWEVTLTLRFIIPKIKSIAGYWEYSTRGALSSIPSIRGAFDTVQQRNGHISGVLFDLTVEFAKSQKPGAKSRFPVVNLIPNHSEENMKLVKEAFLNIQQTPQLSSHNNDQN